MGPVVDVLLVVDGSSAMSPYAELIDSNLRELGDRVAGSRFQLHLTSIRPEPGRESVRAAACADTTGALIFNISEPWWRCSNDRGTRCEVTNRDRGMADTFACLGSRERVSTAEPRVIDALLDVLDPNPELAGFLRDDAMLLVVVIASGDVSVATPSDVRSALERRPSGALMIVVGPPSADALVELGSFSDSGFVASRFVSIEERSWPFFDLGGHFFSPLCLDNIGLDDNEPNNPGVQPATVLELERSSGSGSLVPWCQMVSPERPHPATSLPCTWIDPERSAPCNGAPAMWLEAPRHSVGQLSYEIECGF